MPKEYTREELVDKVVEMIELPDMGRKMTTKKNLMYVMTALGGTFIEVGDDDNEAN